MGSKADTWENGLLDLLFTNEDFTLVGDAGGLRGSVTAGSLYISLHTADPGETGDQTTNEIGYTSYARVAVARSTAQWTVTANAVTNDNDVTFPTCGVTGGTATHFGIGASASGAGKLLYSGALSSSLVISDGITPEFAAGDIDVTES